EEEEKLFPKVQRAFSKDELEDLGARMLRLKESEQSAQSSSPKRAGG
nr:hemerythrin domain-containing protein [Chloroflexota bacterium]